MIHLVIREPLAYQKTLCQALSDSCNGAFTAWFVEKPELDGSGCDRSGENFNYHFLPDVGYWSFYRALRADPRAVVILGDWSSAMALKTLLATWVLGAPVFIWTDHPRPGQRSWVFDRSRKLYLRFLGRHISGFLACGNPTVRHLESLGIHSTITNFPCWVDVPPEWSLPKKCNENASPLRLVAIGRHVPVKAFEVAIKAVALANREASRDIATLDLIGDGEARADLEALAQSFDLENVFTFPGWLPNEAVCRRICDADAVIVPSHFEPYGVVVLEALACGRPVLASDQVIAAIDRDDGSGAIFFHPAGESESLAQQIGTLAGNRKVLEASSRAARSIAEQWPPARAAAILGDLLTPYMVANPVVPKNQNPIPNYHSKSADAGQAR